MKRYLKSLSELPPSGSGGCHIGLLRVANYGVWEGVSPETIFYDLRNSISGSRNVPDREIKEAIKKAVMDKKIPFDSYIPRKLRPKTSISLLRQFIAKGKEFDDIKLSELSKHCLPEESGFHETIAILSTLYKPDDYLFMGSRYEPGIMGRSIRTASDWIRTIQKTKAPPEHIIPNPLTGCVGQTKTGKYSYRADDCVAGYKFAIVEFDNIPKIDQIRFWKATPFCVSALIDSGNKSIHGWIKVNCSNREEWEREIEQRLFGTLLKPMGVDSSCKNESRLSRTPGHFRSETKKVQKLLYLSSGGRIVQ